ncbi:cell division protein FtsI [Actinoplanes sp. NBRC 14428]|uniref:Cell division protein FtsI/penicillin-binding protein 2 n=1 Tax=Pseudosporangium ferrugineum TaxID=439699 RepID=A0A2T0SD68_9ACTN|nr:penicillin-binding transpeptidase domain-containing protein [Pseudosporangium ferrugineum]PRY31331.1 cell division protein FtsI/penicillin-binding protein 2 [Pseudosporangium ferrugineum]BCJ54532.1 cell division protein FtsI [Actinoplanes sp. NBRC 14428]
MHPSGRARRVVAALAGLVLAATGLAACSGSDGPGKTLDAFLDGWRGGDLSKVGFVTAAGGKIAANDVYGQLQELAGDLSKSSVLLSKAGDPKETGDIASGPIKIDWTLPGGAAWSYESTVRLTKANSDGWRVIWEPAIVHSELTDGDRLELRRKTADRADILGADGKALVTKRAVTVIGVVPERIEDQKALLDALIAEIAKVKVTIDRDDLTTRIEGSKPDAFVDVVTLRETDYAKVSAKVRSLTGTITREEERELAPTRPFARATIGTVDLATREDLDANPETMARGDQVGHGGLQERYDAQLRGTAGQAVVVARKTPDDKIEDAQIHSIEPVAGKPIKISLDIRTQNAADAAVAAEKQPSALVAVKISDSSVLAVANGPTGGGVDTAMTGQVPPGSTMKMVSTLGLLDKKAVTLDGKVACPKTKTVSGREFKNSHDMELGSVPFRTDFAKSCNTAFVNLAPALGADGLKAAAAKLGLGEKWDLGADSFSGKISPANTPTELAAATFGQGATAVNPLAMAGATAAVARGQFKQPRLVLEPPPASPLPDGEKLEDTSVKPLRTMMREVITTGTGTALKDVPGDPVYGKTGTAEFADNSDETHSWFIGWQGDVAFAIMVQKGGAGAEAAVPVAERFLRNLAG